MGKSGALFLQGDYQVKCPGLKVKAHSTLIYKLTYKYYRSLLLQEFHRPLFLAIQIPLILNLLHYTF